MNNLYINYENKKEIWKDIVGYEGLYKVSNFGNIKSLDRLHISKYKTKMTKGKILKLTISKSKKRKTGYFCVRLKDINNNIKTKFVHRLVAEAFIPNPNNLETVNHIDGNKLNNNIYNLEWCSYRDNNIHAIKNGLRPKTHRYLKQYNIKLCICDNCKNQFYKQNCCIRKNNFCSFECYNNARKNGNYKQNKKIKETTIRNGIIMVYLKEHPFSNKEGRVSKSRLIAEKYLLNSENSILIENKRYLKPEYKVFHINGNSQDDSLENLMVLTNLEQCKIMRKNKNRGYKK